MTQHLHTGPIQVLVAGLSAILVIQLIRMTAAMALDSDSEFVRRSGKVMGALVHFD